jgi:hypothetical protein
MEEADGQWKGREELNGLHFLFPSSPKRLASLSISTFMPPFIMVRKLGESQNSKSLVFGVFRIHSSLL